MADFPLCIAIHFAKSHSEYAFRFNTGSQQDQTFVSSWNHGTQKRGKTNTCILFDENQSFMEFGYEALQTYSKGSTKQQAKKWYLFENFNMELYDNVIHRELMITAKNGEQMKAMTVFSESLRFLKDHALSKIASHANNTRYEASDATWVLTIPAIWDPAAKQFMREAAIEAGLVTKPERLVIVLEPEAAAAYCKQLPTDGFIVESCGEETGLNDPRTQYMVVDCEGCE